MREPPLFSSISGALVWAYHGVIVAAETVRGAGYVSFIKESQREQLDEPKARPHRPPIELAQRPRSFDAAAQAGMLKGLMSRLPPLDQAHLTAKFLHSATRAAIFEAQRQSDALADRAEVMAAEIRARAKRVQFKDKAKEERRRQAIEVEAAEATQKARKIRATARRRRAAATAQHRAAIRLLATQARREANLPWLTARLSVDIVSVYYGRKLEMKELAVKHDIGRHRLEVARQAIKGTLDALSKRAEERAHAYFHEGGLVA